ncbi:MAG: pyruvate dehydrogenase (acetyl-transferring) E1 component subunit alpha [Candidatus Tectimicrobiota bacterium]
MFFERYDPLKQDMVCILAPDGSCNESLRPALDVQQVRQIYRHMWLLRLYDRKAVSLQRQGRFGTYAQMEGQEACMVASPLALQRQDWMATTYRETGAMWMHGVPLTHLSLYWMGNEMGSQMPEGVRVLPMAIPIGTQPLHAVGLAYASQYRGEDGVAVAYFGDGATSQGDVHEAMNMAGVYRLPCIFFCQNNQYAISLPRHAQTASPTIAQKALAYGFPGVLVDGNDIFAVYAVMQEAVERARRGRGPTLIEAYTYRMGAHTTADDPSKYRDAAEVGEWKGRDPLLRVQRYLQALGQWSEDWEQHLLEACSAEVEQAIAAAAAVPPPPPQDMFRYMYAEMTPPLLEQEAALLAALQQKGEADAPAHTR